MKIPARVAVMCSALFFLVSAEPFNYAQDATTAGSVPSFARRPAVDAVAVQPFDSNVVLSLTAVTSGSASTSGGLLNQASSNASSSTGAGGNIFGLNTLPTFVGSFVPGNATGTTEYRFTMMGNDPLVGGTTELPANVSEVSLQLLNANGSVFRIVPFTPFEDLVEDSPNFVNTNFDSSTTKTQLADAVQRAEFFNFMKANWHTRLSVPNIVNRVTITVPKFVNVILNGQVVTALAYVTGTAADGSTYVLMLEPLFNSLFDNEVVNEINAGKFTTNGVSMVLFPNTYLFSLNTANPMVPGSCCVLGYHTYFYQPGVNPQPRWISLYASWISPGLFANGVQDVTALSHEISESFNDPFVDNIVPSWQFPGQPTGSTVCQNNLETGDPVEVLPTATVLIPVREGKNVFPYHPQNEALLQWFEMGPTPSNAVDGAFSYPDTTVLTRSAVPCGH
jgi:hypothetical protein